MERLLVFATFGPIVNRGGKTVFFLFDNNIFMATVRNYRGLQLILHQSERTTALNHFSVDLVG